MMPIAARHLYLPACLLAIATTVLSHAQVVLLPEPPTLAIRQAVEAMASKSVVEAPAIEAMSQARLLNRAGQRAEAIALLEPAREAAEGIEIGELTSMLGYVKLAAGDRTGAEDEFIALARGIVPATEAKRADAVMRLAYLNFSQRNHDAARAEFLRIATGEIPASPEETVDASLRLGSLLRTGRDARNAIAVYRQIAEHAPKLDDSLYAKLQLAGLLLEDAKGEYGNTGLAEKYNAHVEAIAVCEQIFSTPGVKPETQAIAELMHLENFHFLGDFQTSVALAENYLEQWGNYSRETPIARPGQWNHNRQIATCHAWRIFGLYRLGRYDDCIAACREFRAAGFKDTDPYPLFNVHGYSYLYEALAEERRGNLVAAEILIGIATEQFPEWTALVLPQLRTKLDAPQPNR